MRRELRVGDDIKNIAPETFVIGKDHKIVAAFSSKTNHLTPDAHVTKSLEALQQLAGK